jgi:TonB family protein
MIISWMLRTLVVGVFLAVAALIAERAASWLAWPRRWIWATAIAGSLLLPVLALVLPEFLPAAAILPGLLRSVTGGGDAVLLYLPGITVDGASQVSGGVGSTSRLSFALVFGWIASSVAMLCAIVWSYWRLHVLRRRCEAAEVDGTRALMAERAGPMVVGVLRPAIILPPWVLTASAEERRLILCHEQEHIAGHDTWLLVLATLALAAVPWNLPLWWQHRRLQLAVEIDCDARVLARGTHRRAYGQVLLRTAAGPPSLFQFSPAWGEPAAHLKGRIIAMTTQRRPYHLVLSVPLLGIALGMLVVACDMAGPDKMPTVVSASESVEREVSEVERGSAGGFAYEVAVLERKPELTNEAQVAGLMQRLYPRMLQDAGIGGTVMMQFVIQADGKVDPASVKVIDSTHEQFGEASVKAVEKFRFRPGQYKGQNVRVLIQMPITWQPER